MNSELSELFTKMWNTDGNCCTRGKDYDINLQGLAKYRGGDEASENLFTWFDEEKVFGKKTFRLFKNLLDNYEASLGTAEVVTNEEMSENWEFINTIMETEVMKLAHSFLVSKGKASADEKEFKEALYEMWFELYRRTRGNSNQDSSGFEHVFVGELKRTSVKGFHNWIQLYLQEKLGKINYKGYFGPATPDLKEGVPHILTIQFEWGANKTKAKGSVFIGTSPELEFAIYTAAFMIDEGDVTVQIGDYKVQIICHKLAGKFIGSCFPKYLPN